MKRIAILVMLAAAACLHGAETAEQAPPPKVDKALRERVAQFYQDFLDGQFRKAEDLVAKDSKDIFYNSNKTQFSSYEIQSIKYSDRFRKAEVRTLCEQPIMAPGFAGRKFKLPNLTYWKLEKGKWYWYVDPNAPIVTPFGTMRRSQGVAKTSAPPIQIPKTADLALNKVKADKDSLTLKAGESVELTFSNSALGLMSVVVESGPAGIEASPARADIQRGSKAAITIKVGAGASAGALVFRVEPTGEKISVPVKIE